jgi:hypothetical protein
MTKLLSHEVAPKTIAELLRSAGNLSECIEGEILKFRTEPEELDVYNITAPFAYGGKLLVAGRVETRTDEAHSKTVFFQHNTKGDLWTPEDIPSLDLQDPFVEKIHGQWVVGGVKVHSAPDNPNEVKSWNTHIYCGNDLYNLRLLVVGPDKMKDIRLVELPNRDIGVFTRPQGEKGGVGKVGFAIVQRLRQITTQLLQDAPIIPELFAGEHEEWGGVGEVQVLPDGRLGLLGHVARHAIDIKDNQPIVQYFPWTCVFDYMTCTVDNERIIASRDCFPDTEAKREDLRYVLFSGGMRSLGKLATWWGGVNDTCAAKLIMPNPFLCAAR